MATVCFLLYINTDESVTCCVHITSVGVSQERQEVISMASHVLGCVGSQLFHIHD